MASNPIARLLRRAGDAAGRASPAFAGRFRRDRRGVAAVEFALVLPAMVALYLGCVDITQIMSASRKASNVASAVGDLVAQAIQIDNNGMDNVFAAAESMIEPFPTATLTVVVTSVAADSDGNVKVVWSDAYNTAPRTPGSSIEMPAGILDPNTSVIMSEVTYEYHSPVSELVAGGGVDLNDTFYLRPRRSLMVARVP